VTLVAGIDSSTQSCKVVVCDSQTGTVVRSAAAPHPSGTEIDPEQWWIALQRAISDAGGFDDVAAVSIAAQQHGMVCLDEAGAVVRPALLWNDTRSSSQADDLVAEFGGPDWWAAEFGVVPVASFTVSKLRWLADHEPRNADATAAVCLPHDWLTWRMSGSVDIASLCTDRSDASGTGYFSVIRGEYIDDVLRSALRGRQPRLPRLLAPNEAAGRTASGVLLGPGAGDNAAAALGLSATVGDCMVSLGTSAVVSAVSQTPAHDPEGVVAGFADATGRYLPLVCTLNGAPMLTTVAAMLGVDAAEFSRLALSAPSGADGLVWVPYFAGERSPNLPNASGALHGATTGNLTPANVARAAVEGLLASITYCMQKTTDQGIPAEQVQLLGGAARSEAVRSIAPAILGRPVLVPNPAEFVALGAARQAAWVLTQDDDPPAWPSVGFADYRAMPTPWIVERYNEARLLILDRQP